MERLFWIFVSAVIAIAPANFARAFSITAVRLLPGPQISPSDQLQMEVQITTPGQPPSLYAPTQVAVDSNGVHVDIFPNSGALTVIGYLYETIDLGSFPAGTYNYEVIIHPAQEVNWGSRTNRGIFSVVPGEPPPQLTLEEPRDGQQFSPGDTIPLRAAVTNDSGGPWSVEFFSGDQPVASSIPGRTVWWTEAWGGQHVLTARATNAVGTTLISGSKAIQVGPGATLPVVRVIADPWQTTEPCPTCRVAPSVLTIHRTDPTNAPLTVYLAIDGTATPGKDYQPLPASVEIPAGQHSAQLNLIPLDDQLVEGPEIVRVQVLRQPPPLLPPTYFVSVYAKESLMVILDDEPEAPQARLDIVAPTNGSHLRFPSTVELSALGVYTQNEVYGPVEFYVGDQLVARSPVSATTRPPIPGLPSVHTAYWTNPPVGQYLLSARTRLSFSLWVTSPPVNVTVDAPTLPIVSLETTPSENAQAPEYCPPNADCAYPSFVVRRSGFTNADLRVYLSYSGTATPAADYPALPEGIVIPAGELAAFLMLVPNSDTLIEGPETVVARFTAVPGPGYVQDPARSSATITIIDGGVEWPRVAIATPTNGAQFPPNSTIDIIAETHSPHGYVRTMEFFADGRKIGEVNTQTIRSPEPTPGQTQYFEFRWREPAPGSHLLSARAIDNLSRSTVSAPVSISITVPELPIVTVFATDCVAVEPSSNSVLNAATFRIQRFGPTNSPLTVACSLEGTAQNGVDYEMLPGLAVIPAGSSFTTLTVWPLADNLAEPIETVILRLQDGAQYSLGFRRRAAAIISDTLPPPPDRARWNLLPGGYLHLSYTASTGDNFRLEASSDLRNWETISTTTAADGTADFVEEIANFPRRFYRIAPEPVQNLSY